MLIVSVSGLTESALPGCAELAAELDARSVPISWLLPPRPRPGVRLVTWLRDRVTGGDALVPHGYDHTVVPIGRRLGRRAEFALLPTHEATLRLIAATRALAELGLTSDAFAPPRWLASAGTVVALRRLGFAVCAEAVGVRLLRSDRLLRGRVLTPRPEPDHGDAVSWRPRSLAVSAARAVRRGGVARIDVAAGVIEQARPGVLRAVDAALAAGAHPATYRAPLPVRAPASHPAHPRPA